jgi:hypothetical protein
MIYQTAQPVIVGFIAWLVDILAIVFAVVM